MVGEGTSAQGTEGTCWVLNLLTSPVSGQPCAELAAEAYRCAFQHCWPERQGQVQLALPEHLKDKVGVVARLQHSIDLVRQQHSLQPCAAHQKYAGLKISCSFGAFLTVTIGAAPNCMHI